jgi:hypothetical protein
MKFTILPNTLIDKRWEAMSEQLYVLKTDDRMPSKGNLWGTQAANSPEKAKTLFREKVKGWHSPSSRLGHLQSMEEDRARRLREDDFDVELASPQRVVN